MLGSGGKRNMELSEIPPIVVGHLFSHGKNIRNIISKVNMYKMESIAWVWSQQPITSKRNSNFQNFRNSHLSLYKYADMLI